MNRRKLQTIVIIPAALFIAVILLMFARSLTAAKPAGLGVVDGRLAPVPSSPNCVSTQTDSDQHKAAPIRFSGDAAVAIDCLHSIITAERGVTVTEQQDNYLHAEFRSRIFRFVDDVELFANADTGEIHFRSASRTGHSDFGVNRNRMERIREEFVKRCSEIQDK